MRGASFTESFRFFTNGLSVVIFENGTESGILGMDVRYTSDNIVK